MSRGLRVLGCDPEGGEGAWPALGDGAEGLLHFHLLLQVAPVAFLQSPEQRPRGGFRQLERLLTPEWGPGV